MGLFGNKKEDDHEMGEAEFAALMREAVARAKEKSKLHPLDIDEALSMLPIPDLKMGMKVRWKEGIKPYARVPEKNQVCVVSRVGSPMNPILTTFTADMPVYQNDFCIMFFEESGQIMEYTFDSRYFQEVK